MGGSRSTHMKAGKCSQNVVRLLLRMNSRGFGREGVWGHEFVFVVQWKRREERRG
jgi:hypothetical protein